MALHRALRAGIGVVALGGTLIGVGGTAFASQDPPKVTICHRTASHTNPYVRISVAQSSVDGDLGNDRGRGDHYMEHRGPVGPIPSGEWGDIIPPIPGVHDGLNWTTEGMAAFFNDCGSFVPVEETTTTTAPGSTTTSTTSTTTTSTTTTTEYIYTD